MNNFELLSFVDDEQLAEAAADRWLKEIDQASRKMEDVDVRSRAITKKLRDVEELPSNPQPLLKDFLQTENADALDE